MCGRFTLTIDFAQLAMRFDLFNTDELAFTPRFNAAPSQQIMTIVNDGEQNRAGFLRWGLVPVWAKDPKIGYKMINARAETIDEKPAYKRLLKRRRCLIAADGFYEWKKTGDGKRPYRIKLKNDEAFAFAGLWDRWERDGEVIQSCTVITTQPNELMAPIHNRMPVILSKEDEQAWLDRTLDDSDVVKQMLKPYPAEAMEAYEVSPLVNSPKNDIPEVSEPLKE